MPSVRIIQTTATQRALQHALHPVLCATSLYDSARQGQSQCNADVHSQTQGLTLTRGCFEVRQPDADETPLSESEKRIAEREGWDD